MNRRGFLKLIGCAIAAHALKLPPLQPAPVAYDAISQYADFVNFSDLLPPDAIHPYLLYDLLHDKNAVQIDLDILRRSDSTWEAHS